MATKRQLSKVIYKWEEYEIIWANVNDATITLKNKDWTVTIDSFTLNQWSNKNINLPIPEVTSWAWVPSTAPTFIGDRYVDTNTNLVYVAKWISSASDWVLAWDKLVYITQDDYDALWNSKLTDNINYVIIEEDE